MNAMNDKIANWHRLKLFFDISQDKDKESDIIQNITSGVSFTGANLWILIFAVFIASLGLNVNSTAVIIGAMLISPLMGPILGIGLAIGINDLSLLKRAGKNLLIATLISIVTATIYFLLSPYKGVQSELLARTSPTIYDVLIALFGGAAGIIAQCTKDKGNVIPGVAIATALMPPLCTAGYGIATGSIAFFAGAFFLYFINSVFITVATYVGVLLMKFRQIEYLDPSQKKIVHRTIVAVIIFTMIPAGIMTVKILRESFFNRQLDVFSEKNLNWNGTQIVAQNMVNDSTLRIVAVGKIVTDTLIEKAQKNMGEYSQLQGIKLEVIQGVQSDSFTIMKEEMGISMNDANSKINIIRQQSAEIAKLTEDVNHYKKFENASVGLIPEIKILYPGIRSISLTPITEIPTDTIKRSHYVLAVLKVSKSHRQTAAEQKQMTEWLKARINADSLVIMTKRDNK